MKFSLMPLVKLLSMNNIFIITKREYLTQVKKKSFVILTIMGPLLMAAFGILISMMFKANETSSVIQVVDHSGLFKNELRSGKNIVYIPIEKGNGANIKKDLESNEELAGFLVIPSLKENNFDALEKNTMLWVNQKIGFDTKQKISNDLKQIIQKEKVKALGLSETDIQSIEKDFNLHVENVNSKEKADSDMAFTVKSSLGMILMYITFMFIMIYGVRVMRSVLEEKNNRVVEILISSVKPFDLMMGKILGVTLVALTQFTIWITMSVTAAFFLNASFLSMQNQIPGNTVEIGPKIDIQQMAGEITHILLDLNFPLIIIVFIVFFLLGYIFYSSIYAAIGSAVDNETETQQFTLFAILPLMIGMYGSFTIMNNPDGPMAFWLSIIPFTSPVAMIARIPYGVPIWQIALSFGLLLGSTLFMVYIASKIYRIGILLYGNKATVKELIKWIRS